MNIFLIKFIYPWLACRDEEADLHEWFLLILLVHKLQSIQILVLQIWWCEFLSLYVLLNAVN